ncbi:MAG TPA: hypothetical protein VKZ84_01335 [Bacteriovoracaceae bacterium]|nr:hypothetical protein [Bacteriovoracaceae bacterium]
MKALSSYNPRYIELAALFILFILLSFFSFSAAGLMALGFIWNWTLQFEIEKLKTNKRYRFSTLKLVFSLNQIFQLPFKNMPKLEVFIRILPAGIFWGLVGWFLGSLDFWWAPFLGSGLYEGLNILVKKLVVSP